MKTTQTKAEVLSVKRLGGEIFLLSLRAPSIARRAKPGQFVNILCGEGRDYILRRPFSVYRKTDDSIEILFQVLGKGTSFLKDSQPRSTLDLIGPLGHPFDLTRDAEVLLAAGGMGVAPLRLLAEQLRKKKKKVHFVLGARSSSYLPFRKDLKEISTSLFYATEDGSLGSRGMVTDFLPDLLEKIKPGQVYSCGPELMLKRVAELTQRLGVPCQVSLERRMACGLGVCLSCVAPVRSAVSGWEYKRVCREGPVFDAGEVFWDEA